eukprot:UN18569
MIHEWSQDSIFEDWRCMQRFQKDINSLARSSIVESLQLSSLEIEKPSNLDAPVLLYFTWKFEDITYNVKMAFTKFYPFRPPMVYITRKPEVTFQWHPNVVDDRLKTDLLELNWSASLVIIKVIHVIQNLLT